MEEEEGGDPFRQVVQLMKPCLGCFGFKPSQVQLLGQAEGLPAMPLETKRRIVRHEREEEMQRATTVYLHWLLESLPLEPDGLRPFLRALRKTSTREHQHVHDVLCVGSVYLPAHRPLLHALAPRLRPGGSVQLPALLGLLRRVGLLRPQRAPDVLNAAGEEEEGDGDSGGGSGSDSDGQEERGSRARAATLLLVCLYSRQAEILHEMHSNANDGNSSSDMGTGGAAPPSPSHDSDVREPHKDDDVIAHVMEEDSQVSTSPGGNPPEEGSDRYLLPSSLAENVSRLSPELLQEGERWPELLTEVLVMASRDGDREWPYALRPQAVRSLWEAAGGLIRSGLREGQTEANEENDDEQSEVASEDSAATIRANTTTTSTTTTTTTNYNNNDNNSERTVPKGVDDGANLLQTREERTKDYVKTLPVQDNIVGEVFHHHFPDDASVASVDSNSRQRGRTAAEGGGGGGGGGGGVLREEEMVALRSGGPIRLRSYQDELLEDARRGVNVLIWLPTGTGKTYIVLKYAEEHLKAAPDRCVAFVVPKVRLARQQYERFQAYLPGFKPHLRCGETSGTSSGRQPLGEVLKTSRVAVLTAQSLVEAVERGRVALERFTLLVLDECHHTRGGHPLRVLMNQYMEAKFQRRATLPQVIGLTASPGVGKARGKEVEEAVKYLRQLCARLDVSSICSVRRHVEDLKQHVHEPIPDVWECVQRKVDKLKDRLEKLMDIIEDSMLSDCELEKYLTHLSKNKPAEDLLLRNLRAPKENRGEDQYTQWISQAEKTLMEVTHRQAFYSLTAHLNMLRLCQRGLVLNEDCDSPGVLQLLKDEVDLMRREKPTGPASSNKNSSNNAPHPVDKRLFDIFADYIDDFSLLEECHRRNCQNPKLQRLEELLLCSVNNDSGTTKEASSQGRAHPGAPSPGWTRQEGAELPDLGENLGDGAEGLPDADDVSELTSTADSSEWGDNESVTGSEKEHLENHVRGMIFVRTLDLSKALLNWMRRHPKLRYLNPDRITGVNASVRNGGMTQKEVNRVTAQFNEGTIKVVICTSAAEEGLDFKACNFVIRYLYEASMVSMIQIRGRARDRDSRYSLLGQPNTLAKERDNRESELAMQEAVRTIQRAADRDPQAHHAALQKMQKEAWDHRWRKDVDERKRLQRRLEPGEYRLLCRNCRLPACTSQEIRLLRTTNRVVIGTEFRNKCERRDEGPEGKNFDPAIKRTGKIHCKACGSYWGILVRSLDDDLEYPVIPLRRFLVESGTGIKNVEQWSHAFDVPEIDQQDRLRHFEPLSDPQDQLEQPEEDQGSGGEPSQDDERIPPEPEAPEEDQEERVRGNGGEPSQDPEGVSRPGDLQDLRGRDSLQASNGLNDLSLPSP